MALNRGQLADLEAFLAGVTREQERSKNALSFAIRSDKPFVGLMATLLSDEKLSLVKGERSPLPRPRKR